MIARNRARFYRGSREAVEVTEQMAIAKSQIAPREGSGFDLPAARRLPRDFGLVVEHDRPDRAHGADSASVR